MRRTRSLDFKVFFRLEFVILGKLDRPAARLLSVLSADGSRH